MQRMESLFEKLARAGASRAVAGIPNRPLGVRAVEHAQRDSIAQRLGTNFLYPILFGEE